VRFTAQKGHSGLSSMSITAEWVALVYPVRKLLMTTYSRHRFGVCVQYVVWFALFHGCGGVLPFFLFVFFLYPFYQVLCGEFGVGISSFSASFAVSFPDIPT
jgi:hypothetical protein